MTAANQTVPYGTPVAPYSYTISGFVNGDTQATAVTGTASLSTTPAAPTAVNSYPITAALGSLAASELQLQLRQRDPEHHQGHPDGDGG